MEIESKELNRCTAKVFPILSFKEGEAFLFYVKK